MSINKTKILEVFNVLVYVDDNSGDIDKYTIVIDGDVYSMSDVVLDGRCSVNTYLGELSDYEDYIKTCRQLSFHYLPSCIKQAIAERLPMDGECIENIRFLIRRELIGD